MRTWLIDKKGFTKELDLPEEIRTYEMVVHGPLKAINSSNNYYDHPRFEVPEIVSKITFYIDSIDEELIMTNDRFELVRTKRMKELQDLPF